MVVGQFHDVVETLGGAADVQDVNESSVGSRDRLEARHPLKLALKGAFAFEGAAINHFHRPYCTSQTSRQPDFAVSAAPNHAQNFVIRNDGKLRGNGMFRPAVFHFVSDGCDFNITFAHEAIPGSAHALACWNIGI